MSVINQMLQSLDQRGAVDELVAPLRSQVRVVSQQRSSQWLVLAVLMLGLAATTAWLNGRYQLPMPMPRAAPALPVPIAATTPAVETPLAIPPAAAEQVAQSLLPAAARLSLELSALPAPATEAAPPAAAAVAATKPRAVPPPAPEPVSLIKQVSPQQQAESEFRKAVALLQQGRASEAGESFAEVLQLDPLHAAARQTWVGLLLESKRVGEAAQLLRAGLQLDPKQAGFAMAMARIELEQGEMLRALATLRAGLPYAANNADYQAFMAALLQRQQHHGEAIERYLEALRIAPQSGVWLMGLGISLQAENRGAEAQQAFQRALASNALNPELQAFVEQRLRQLAR